MQSFLIAFFMIMLMSVLQLLHVNQVNANPIHLYSDSPPNTDLLYIKPKAPSCSWPPFNANYSSFDVYVYPNITANTSLTYNGTANDPFPSFEMAVNQSLFYLSNCSNVVSLWFHLAATPNVTGADYTFSNLPLSFPVKTEIRPWNISSLIFQKPNGADRLFYITDTPEISFFNTSFSPVNPANQSLVNGGAFFVDNSTLRLFSCSFNEFSGNMGGSIYLEEFGVLLTVSSQFISNSAQYGGAIYAKSSSATISQALFTHNSAIFSGGSMTFLDSILSMENSIILNSTVTNGTGGGIHWSSSPLTATIQLSSNLLKNNQASDKGGDIYFQQSSSSPNPQFSSVNTQFNQSVSPTGSSLYFAFENYPSALLSPFSFVNSTFDPFTAPDAIGPSLSAILGYNTSVTQTISWDALTPLFSFKNCTFYSNLDSHDSTLSVHAPIFVDAGLTPPSHLTITNIPSNANFVDKILQFSHTDIINSTSLYCSPGREIAANLFVCRICRIGMYSPTVTTGCFLCNPGTYSPDWGSISCKLCPANTSMNPTLHGAISEGSCLTCPSPSYSPPGSTECTHYSGGSTGSGVHPNNSNKRDLDFISGVALALVCIVAFVLGAFFFARWRSRYSDLHRHQRIAKLRAKKAKKAQIKNSNSTPNSIFAEFSEYNPPHDPSSYATSFSSSGHNNGQSSLSDMHTLGGYDDDDISLINQLTSPASTSDQILLRPGINSTSSQTQPTEERFFSTRHMSTFNQLAK